MFFLLLLRLFIIVMICSLFEAALELQHRKYILSIIEKDFKFNASGYFFLLAVERTSFYLHYYRYKKWPIKTSPRGYIKTTQKCLPIF